MSRPKIRRSAPRTGAETLEAPRTGAETPKAPRTTREHAERAERAELSDQAPDPAPFQCPKAAPDCPAFPENGRRYCPRCVRVV